ncbi:hypothetical protein Sjap_011132 [Stephania japonica]|uniref:CUE domain-containing protein n=1 Tax=Stephania japonica TaxID=461633 RepID=A0AAP0P750_9MAGN
MSAILCRKRSFFEDLPTSPPILKRSRCSPIRISPPRFNAANVFSPRASSPSSQSADQSHTASLLPHLQSLFPNTDKELLWRALEECGDDMDSSIKRLNELCVASAEENLRSSVAKEEISLQVTGGVSPQDLSSADFSPQKGSDWVELFVKEMINASSLDDARTRASRVLEFLEKSIRDHVGAEIVENTQKENMILKGQMEVVLRENTILKRAVAIQHERQKDYDEKNVEREQLKQLLAQCQEQLRKLEVNNYALTMHLKQSQQNSSIPGRFHPDIF